MEYVNLTTPNQAPYKDLVKGKILGQLIIRNYLNNRVRKFSKKAIPSTAPSVIPIIKETYLIY